MSTVTWCLGVRSRNRTRYSYIKIDFLFHLPCYSAFLQVFLAGTVSPTRFRAVYGLRVPTAWTQAIALVSFWARQGCRIDLRNDKGSFVSELVSSSVQDSQGGWDLFFSHLSPCVQPRPLPWACSLPTALLWFRPGAEAHLMTKTKTATVSSSTPRL